jgi:hypothetical protein
MRSVSPVIHFESCEAKNTAAGEMLHSRAASFSYGIVSSFSSVSIIVGALWASAKRFAVAERFEPVCFHLCNLMA